MHELTSESAWWHATGGPWPNPEELSGDERAMAEAIKEGLTGVGLSSPNPSVGCVLMKDGRVIGRGAHRKVGDPHAEVWAIREASSHGETTIGAAAYVTLEPCCHFGLTPPCTDALLQAGIKKVVIGIKDRNPRVAGGGIATLRASGVEVIEGVLENACFRLHAPFFKTIQTGLPWVMLKLALGSDSGIGPIGARTNITGANVQKLAHSLRRACDGILVGRNTVESDDPQLTDRWPMPTLPHRMFRRIVLDSQGKLSHGHRVWQKECGHLTLRALTTGAAPINGAEDLRLPPGPGGCSLRHLLHELTLRGVSRLLVEGGPTLAMQLLNDDLVDVVHIFRSTKPVGGSIVALNMDKFRTAPILVDFDGGIWEIWDKPINVA